MKRAPSSRPLLQWTFQRRGRFLTCQVTAGPRGCGFTLSLIPHFEGADERVETFDSGISALHRHAMIAAALRARGWRTASYGNPRDFAVSQAA